MSNPSKLGQLTYGVTITHYFGGLLVMLLKSLAWPYGLLIRSELTKQKTFKNYLQILDQRIRRNFTKDPMGTLQLSWTIPKLKNHVFNDAKTGGVMAGSPSCGPRMLGREVE